MASIPVDRLVNWKIRFASFHFLSEDVSVRLLQFGWFVLCCGEGMQVLVLSFVSVCKALGGGNISYFQCNDMEYIYIA